MERHKTSRRNQDQADDLCLLDSLLSKGLNQSDRQLLYGLLAQPAHTPLAMCAARPLVRRQQRARMGLRTASAVLLVGGALALSVGSTALFTTAAQAQPAAIVSVADTRVARDDTVLLQTLLSSPAAPRVASLKDARIVAMHAQQAADRAAAQLDSVDTLRAEQISAVRELALHKRQAADRAAAQLDSVDTLRAEQISGQRELAMHKQDAVATANLADAQLVDPQFADMQLTVGETLVIPTAPQAVSDTAPASTAISTYYTVRSGDTLWDIARYFYGNGVLWGAIYQANRNIISNPNLIYPGQVFAIPAAGAVDTSIGIFSTPILPIITGNQYTVVSGDNLSTIALRAYGDGNLWPRLFAANWQISNPNLIYPGQVFTIPR